MSITDKLSGISELFEQADSKKEGGLVTLPVELLQRGKYQPRSDMHPKSLEELADSIRSQGVVQPIVVRPIGEGHYEIIAGERRWRASQMAGLTEVPVIIREVTDNTAAAMALIENIQRENLSPLEEAHATQRLLDQAEGNRGNLIDAIGKSKSWVTKRLALLTINDPLQKISDKNALQDAESLYLLAQLYKHDPNRAQAFFNKPSLINREALTEAKEKAANKKPKASKKKAKKRVDPDIRKFEDNLSEKLGAQVKVQMGKEQKGKLLITFHSLDELDGIMEHIN